MKKVLSMLITIILPFAMIACGNNNQVQETKAPEIISYELAMVIGEGNLEDGGCNEAIWNSIEKYASENDKKTRFYQAPQNETLELFTKIEEAISQGAKIVICVGDAFEEAVFYAGQTYPEIHFVIIDGAPHNSDKTNYNLSNNTIAVLYDGETAGLIKKTFDGQSDNSEIQKKLSEVVFNIIKDYYNGQFQSEKKLLN